jgi:hypothetical protein
LQGEKSTKSKEAFNKRLRWEQKDAELSDDEPVTERDKLRMEWDDNKARAKSFDIEKLKADVKAKQQEFNKKKREVDTLVKKEPGSNKISGETMALHRLANELIQLIEIMAFTGKTDEGIAGSLRKLYTTKNMASFIDPKHMEDLEIMFPLVAVPDTRPGSLDPNAEVGNQPPVIQPLDVGLLTADTPAPPPAPLLPFAGQFP